MKSVLNLKKKRVLVLLGTSSTGDAFFKNDLNEKRAFTFSNLNVEIYRSGKMNEWKSKILKSKKERYDYLLIAADIALTGDSNIKENVKSVVKWISKNSPLPTFTVHEGQIGKDMILGGMVLSGVFMGEDAGEIAKNILNKSIKNLSNIFKNQTKGDLIFSKSQLEKWGLAITPQFTGKVKIVD